MTAMEPELPVLALCPFCTVTSYLSEEDPDAGFGDMLRHVRSGHSSEDRSPSVLWPKIKFAKVVSS